MRRLGLTLTTSVGLLLLTAPAAFAHDGGQGWLGEVDDKQVTNAGFILIAFFPLFVLFMSLLQWQLDKRKASRKQAHKKLEGEWHSGW
jgi:hypothetical protein